MKLRKNRAIEGRRNRCHTMGPIFQAVNHSLMYDKQRAESVKRAMEMYMRGNTAVLLHDPDIRVIQPGKRPRFIEASDYGQLVTRIIILENEVKKLKVDSHPPVDLTNAILEIMKSANAIK